MVYREEKCLFHIEQISQVIISRCIGGGEASQRERLLSLAAVSFTDTVSHVYFTDTKATEKSASSAKRIDRYNSPQLQV